MVVNISNLRIIGPSEKEGFDSIGFRQAFEAPGCLGGDTLPETNSKFAPENRPGPKRTCQIEPTMGFLGANWLLVFGGG